MPSMGAGPGPCGPPWWWLNCRLTRSRIGLILSSFDLSNDTHDTSLVSASKGRSPWRACAGVPDRRTSLGIWAGDGCGASGAADHLVGCMLAARLVNDHL